MQIQNTKCGFIEILFIGSYLINVSNQLISFIGNIKKSIVGSNIFFYLYQIKFKPEL